MDDRTNWPGMNNADLAEELDALRKCLAARTPPTRRMLDALDEAFIRFEEMDED